MSHRAICHKRFGIVEFSSPNLWWLQVKLRRALSLFSSSPWKESPVLHIPPLPTFTSGLSPAASQNQLCPQLGAAIPQWPLCCPPACKQGGEGWVSTEQIHVLGACSIPLPPLEVAKRFFLTWESLWGTEFDWKCCTTDFLLKALTTLHLSVAQFPQCMHPVAALYKVC